MKNLLKLQIQFYGYLKNNNRFSNEKELLIRHKTDLITL